MNEILKLSNEIDYENLVYDFKGQTPSINFAILGGPMFTYNHLKNGDQTLQQVEKEQEDFKKLNKITSGNLKHKSEKQSYTIKSVKNLYNSRQKNIDLRNDNEKFRFDAIYKSKQDETKGTRLKILTQKTNASKITNSSCTGKSRQ